MSRPSPRAARGRAAVTVLGAVVLLAGCGAGSGATRSSSPTAPTTALTSTGPRPLTENEADRLAVARFLAYQGTGVRFTTTVDVSAHPVRIVGDVDYRNSAGIAAAAGAGSTFVLQWNATRLLAWPGGGGGVPTTLPAGRPAGRALDPGGSDVDTLLALVLQLGQDRPDNPQLIQGNGARWLRSATLDGRKVDVESGPTVRAGTAGTGNAVVYWVDMNGNLLRVQARLGGSGGLTTIDLDAGAFRAVPRSPLLTAG